MAEKNSLRGSGKKPTTEMIRQERKIKAKKAEGGPVGEDENDIPYRPLSMPMEGYEWENRPKTKSTYDKSKSKKEVKSNSVPVNKQGLPYKNLREYEVSASALPKDYSEPRYVAERDASSTKVTPAMSTSGKEANSLYTQNYGKDMAQNIKVGLDIGQFTPAAPIAYGLSLPFTAYDVASDLYNGQYNRAAIDALGFIPGAKAIRRVRNTLNSADLLNDIAGDEIDYENLTNNPKQKAEGGYYPTQGPPKALFKGYANGGYIKQYDTGSFVTEEGEDDLGKILADLRKQSAKPVGSFSDWKTQSTKPASTLPTAQENFINATKDISRNRKPVKIGINYTTKEQMAARPYPASGSLTPVYPEAVLAAGPAVNLAKSALGTVGTVMNAPFTVGSTTIPGLTANNLLTGYFASKVPGNLQQGEYIDATLNGLPMVGPVLKESYNAAKTVAPIIKNVANAPNTKLSLAFQSPAERLVNPEAYRVLTGRSSGIRGSISEGYYNFQQKNILKAQNKLAKKVYNARRSNQDDLAESFLEKRSALDDDYNKLQQSINGWRLKYSGLPITRTNMGGGQGSIFKNNLNQNELIKVGSYFGNEQSLNNLVELGKTYNNPNVAAAFPTKAIPFTKAIESNGFVGESINAAQFMPKLDYSGGLYSANQIMTPEQIKFHLNELNELGLGIDYTTSAANIGSVGNKLGLVDLTHVGPAGKRTPNYFDREGLFNPTYRNEEVLGRFKYNVEDWSRPTQQAKGGYTMKNNNMQYAQGGPYNESYDGIDGEIDPNINEAYQWEKKYTNSSRFKELSKKQGDSRRMTKARINAVNNFDLSRDIVQLPESPEYQQYVGTGRDGRIKYYRNNQLGDWDSMLAIDNHELGHLPYNNGSLDFPKDVYNDMVTKNLEYKEYQKTGKMDKNIEHDILPNETRADKNWMLFQLQKAGIYDATKDGDVNQEHLNKFKESGLHNRLNRLYTDEDIIWLINNVAQNNNPNAIDKNVNKIEHAATGGYIKVENTMKNNNKFQKNYPQYAKGGPFKNTGYDIPKDQRSLDSIISSNLGKNITDDKGGRGYDYWINKLQNEDDLTLEEAIHVFNGMQNPMSKRNSLYNTIPFREEDYDSPPDASQFDLYTGSPDIANIGLYRPNQNLQARRPAGYGDPEYANGGYTNPYNQYQDDPYNQYKVGGKAMQGVGNFAYGVLKGTVNTVTGGLTKGIMDKGQDALQKAANPDFDPNDPNDVKAMGQIDTAGAAGRIGGSILGGAVSGNVKGAAGEGIGGITDVVNSSGASDEAKQWTNTIGGLAQTGLSMSGSGAKGAAKGAESAEAAGSGASGFGDIMSNFSGTKFGQNASKAMPLINQASGMIGDNKGSLSEQGQAQQAQLNSPDYIEAQRRKNEEYTNQGLMYGQGGNMSNNSLNLRDTMRYKKFAQGGSFSQHGINIIPKSGALHHQSADGGIPFQGGGALAEGGEIIMDNQDGSKYVVSDRVDGAETQPDFTFSKDGKYKELNRSLADGMNQDLKKYTMAGLATNPKFKNDEKRPYGNRPAKPHTDQIKEKWQLKTEYARQRSQHDKAIAQAEEQKRMAEEQYIAAYGGRINPKKYPGLNMSKKAKGGYIHNQMTQPMYAQGGNPWVPPDQELLGMGYAQDQVEAIKLADQQSPVFNSEADYNDISMKAAVSKARGDVRNENFFNGQKQSKLDEALRVGTPLQSLQNSVAKPVLDADLIRSKIEDYDDNRLRNLSGSINEDVTDYERRRAREIEIENMYGPYIPEENYARGGRINYTTDMYNMYAMGGMYGNSYDEGGLNGILPTQPITYRTTPGQQMDLSSINPMYGQMPINLDPKNNYANMPRPDNPGIILEAEEEKEKMPDYTGPRNSIMFNGKVDNTKSDVTTRLNPDMPTNITAGQLEAGYNRTLGKAGLTKFGATGKLNFNSANADGTPVVNQFDGSTVGVNLSRTGKNDNTITVGGTWNPQTGQKSINAAGNINWAGGGPMPSNLPQAFNGPSAQNRGGMYAYPDGGMMPPQDQQMMQEQQMQQQGGGQEQMMQMVEQAAQMLEQGAQPEQVMQQLVQAGVPQDMAMQAVQIAMQELQGQMQQQGQEQPMQGQEQMMPPQQGMARGGMYPNGGPGDEIPMPGVNPLAGNQPIYTPDSGIEQYLPPGANDFSYDIPPARSGNVVSWPSYPEQGNSTTGIGVNEVGVGAPPVRMKSRGKSNHGSGINWRKLGRGFRDLTRGDFSFGRPTSKGPTQCETSFADGGMMSPQDGMASQVAQQLQQGAQPQQVLQQLISQGMPQEQAMAMVQAVMGQLKNQMQQQQPQQQMAPQQPMMASGGYFNGKKQYDGGSWAPNQNKGNSSNTFSPLADESRMSQIAGIGQAVVPALTSAFAFNKLSKRKIKPTPMEAALQNRDAEISALRDEWRGQTAAGLRQLNNLGQGAGAGNVRELILSSLKEGQKPIMQIYSELSAANQQAEQQARLSNKQAKDDFTKENESMYQNAMQTGFEAADRGVKSLASYYADKENRNLQRWQAQNTVSENKYWTPKGLAHRDPKDGKFYINRVEVDFKTGDPIDTDWAPNQDDE